eukprot:12374530-Ditylum_brightwellii.AAC.1
MSKRIPKTNSPRALSSYKEKSFGQSETISVLSDGKENNEPECEQVALQLTMDGEVSEFGMSVDTFEPLTTDTTCDSSVSSEDSMENRDDLHTENTAPPACLMKLSPDFAIDVLPLHIACLFRASSEVIASLIRAYPEGVRHRNKWGMLPLHIVCSGVTGIPEIKSIATSDNLSHGFLKNLMKVRGNALSADRKDWDIAFIVSMLVSIFPESVYTECEHPQRMTPADCARDGLPEGPTKERVMRILNSHLANKNNCQHHAEPKDVSQADTKSKTKLSSFIMKQDWPSVNKRIFHHPEEA